MTSIVGIVFIVTFSIMPDNMIFLSLHLLLSKLYANSLLATLNFRSAHRGRGFETDDCITIPMTSMTGGRRFTGSFMFNNPKDSTGQTTSTRSGPVVHIVKTTTTDEPDYAVQAKDYDGGNPVKGDKEAPFQHADYDFEMLKSQTPTEGSGAHAA
ncbi:hypothetical protein C8Q80DRAFT_187744 [Daedaleopsis nitida]|nr:hypothetical protein C8Q80DRAFT_187744 [Daedaleopsis nitida]